MLNDAVKLEIKQKLLGETARISWLELQRFFARGSVLLVNNDQDLIEVAYCFADDKADLLKSLLENGCIAAPSDRQARLWFETKAQLWSVVVAPYVLVQERKRIENPAI